MSDLEQNTPQVEAPTEAVEATESVETVEAPEVAEAVEAPETSDWRDLLEEDLKTAESLKDYKDVNSLTRSHVHLQQLLGKKVKDLSPEEAKELAQLRGAPKSAEEYKFPENADPELTGWASEVFAKEGIPQETAEHLTEEYMRVEEMKREEYELNLENTRKQWEQELKQEFGSAKDERVNLAYQAARTYGGNELIDMLEQTRLGEHPAAVKAFAKIGQEMAEDKLTTAEVSRKIGMTPVEAQAQIRRKLADPEFKAQYTNPRSPGYEAANKEMAPLYEAAYQSE